MLLLNQDHLLRFWPLEMILKYLESSNRSPIKIIRQSFYGSIGLIFPEVSIFTLVLHKVYHLPKQNSYSFFAISLWVMNMPIRMDELESMRKQEYERTRKQREEFEAKMKRALALEMRIKPRILEFLERNRENAYTSYEIYCNIRDSMQGYPGYTEGELLYSMLSPFSSAILDLKSEGKIHAYFVYVIDGHGNMRKGAENELDPETLGELKGGKLSGSKGYRIAFYSICEHKNKA